MKRFALKLALFLLLGAVANVAVAWGLTLLKANAWEGWDFYTATNSDKLWWSIHCPFPAPIRPDDSGIRQGLGMSSDCFASIPLYGNPSFERVNVVRFRTGFPLLTVEGWKWYKDGDMFLSEGTLSTGADIPLLFRPISPGFAINTIFYAAILWLLCALPGVPFALRRRRRIRRGLCPKCAYDLRGGNHAACPECGKAVKRQ